MSTPLHTDTDSAFPHFLAGGGRMGEAIRRYDWAYSPLGELDSWPGALRTVTGLMLHSPNAMCVVWGPELTLLYNDQYHTLLAGRGTDPCAFLGKPFRIVWPEVWEELGPMLASTMRGQPVAYEDRRFVVVRNGVPEEMFVSFSTSPVFDGQGNIGGVLCICSETSDRVRTRRQRDAALEELERSDLERRQVERRLRLLDAIGEATRLAGDPEAIMAHSTRLLGEFMDVTRVAYADLEADNDRFNIRYDWHVEGVGSTVGVYSLDLFGAAIAGSLRAGRTTYVNDVNTELAPGDGREMFNHIGTGASICCPLVKQGRLVALMAVHQSHPRKWTAEEIALVEAVVERCWAHIERVRSHVALREADRRKSEFLATLAHELRNPLAPIRSSLDVLRIAADRPGMLDKVRGIMERQVAHMTHLINDLLDIARISSGKVVLKVERVSLQAIVDGAVEASRHLIEGAEHRFVVDVPDAPVWVDGDPVRLTQILVNLLSNAAKYTARGGSMELAVAVNDGHATLRVSDNGIGIAPESLEAVFEMFSQAHPSAAISKGGLGIGLSLVRHLVTLHGGTVTASSAGPNQGSSFTVRLPLAEPKAGAGDALRVGEAFPAPLGAMRILLADDNVDAAETLSSLLQLQGHLVTVAHDGEQAVRLAAEGAYDLVVLDIGMPVMDGYQAARALRSMPQTSAACLVALTGWGAEEDRARTRAAGFDHHLLKPVQLSEIQNILVQSASGPAGRRGPAPAGTETADAPVAPREPR